MRCKTCHYSLAKLTVRRCPECGNPFDPNDPTTVLLGKPWPRPARFLMLGSIGCLAIWVAMSLAGWPDEPPIGQAFIAVVFTLALMAILVIVYLVISAIWPRRGSMNDY